MNSKITAIVTYITWVGLIVAIAIGEKDEFSRHHINQSFMIWLLATIGGVCIKLLGIIPVIGKLCAAVFGIVDGVLGIMAVVGIICAIIGSDYKLPVVGKVQIF